MIYNQFIICDTCNTKMNLRSQIGHFNIPFNINCPICSTLIYGKVNINQESIGVRIEVENAHIETVETNSKEKYYSAELSAEFPTKKMYLRGFGIDNYEVSPFIRNAIFYKDSSNGVDALRNAMLFAHHFKDRWKKIKVYFNLIWNNQSKLLYPKLEKEISNYEFITVPKITNDLDATMSLHQLLLTTSGLSNALPPETLNKYINISSLMIINTEIIKENQKYASIISFRFNDIEKKAFKLIDVFSKIYEQLIPVVALRNTESLSNVDKEQYGIMTTNFEELSDFYAKSYEWILDNIDIVIGLNNVTSRNDYTACANGKNYDELSNLGSKIQKLKFINETEPFSTPTNSLKNRIRNSIQHFDSEIDFVTQEITFTDRHRGKVKKESLYLIDLADLCIENFSVIIYILELVYQLRRLEYVSEGLVSSAVIKGFQKGQTNKPNKKIGRNEPCPCGSGKKYKKCCL